MGREYTVDQKGIDHSWLSFFDFFRPLTSQLRIYGVVVIIAETGDMPEWLCYVESVRKSDYQFLRTIYVEGVGEQGKARST